MTDMAAVLIGLSEDELDALVSIAIHRAEILDEMQSPAAHDAWHEVMVYEERLATITDPGEVPGGVARVGAVTAALAAGRRSEAARLASRFLAEESLPSERRAAIQRAFHEDQERLARRFPALAKSGRLAELAEWRDRASKDLRVFPRAA
jgi:hypothetical protein